jgi:hypothetical protein
MDDGIKMEYGTRWRMEQDGGLSKMEYGTKMENKDKIEDGS